jgi:hypothetical protein
VTKVPIACTLDSADQVVRADEWRRIKSQALNRELTDTGARLTFSADAATATAIADLVVREVDCCAFLSFTLSIATGQVVLTVSAPQDAQEILAAFVS